MNDSNAEYSSLSPESLQLFVAGLAGLSEDEVRKAKELFLRNAITEYKSEIKVHKNNYFKMALHLLIPIFWPMLSGSQRESKIELEEKKNKILNALQVWRDDLPNCYRELKAMLDEPVTQSRATEG